MKRLRPAVALVFFCLATIQITAQRHHQQGPPSIEEMAEALDLTTDQVDQLKALHETQRTEAKALREKEFDNEEAKKAALKALRQSHRSALEEILTEDQLTALRELKHEHRGKRGKKGDKSDRSALREALKEHHETKVLPVLLAKRTEFDAQLSEEDKATLAGLRPFFEEMDKNRKQKEAPKEERLSREDRQAEREAFREANADKFEALKDLVEKYESELDAVKASLADQRESWKEETRAIFEQHRPEDRQEKDGVKNHGRKHHQPHLKGFRNARFLLMNPDEAPSATQAFATVEIKVYPNPTVDQNTLAYEVKSAGKVRIELRDQSGNLLRVLQDTYLEPGTYQVQNQLGDQRTGIYFYTITNGKEIISKKIILE